MPNFLCTSGLQGSGSPCINLTPITVPNAILLARPGFTFTNSEACDTLSDWNTAIANKDLIVINDVSAFENQKVENGVYTSPTGEKTHLWDGVKGGRMLIQASLAQHKIIRTYSRKKWDVFFLDRANYITGLKNSDDSIQGIPLDYFFVDQQTQPTEAEPAMTPIEFQYSDATEYDSIGFYFEPSFRISKIKPIYPVITSSGAVAANEFTMEVYYQDTSTAETDGTAVTVPLSGLDAPNLEVIDQDGNTVTATVTETATEGTYTVAGTMTSGSVQVKPIAAGLYESPVETLSA